MSEALLPAQGQVDRRVMPHTTGPWRIGTAGSLYGANYSLLGRKRNGWVNILHGNDRHTTATRATSAEAHANARLMAAAPDLLEALRDMVSDRECLSDATIAFAKAAIFKATGHEA